MIILDTNVISEAIKLRASDRVVAWLDAQERRYIFATAINIAELWQGVTVLAEGKRKRELEISLSGLLAKLFINDILSFDNDAALVYAQQLADLRKLNYTMSTHDAQIAAIARVHNFTVATRDVEPFRKAGVPVINPWEPR